MGLFAARQQVCVRHLGEVNCVVIFFNGIPAQCVAHLSCVADLTHRHSYSEKREEPRTNAINLQPSHKTLILYIRGAVQLIVYQRSWKLNLNQWATEK